MYEPKREPPISYRRFITRVLIHAAISVGVLVFSLMVGVIGYEHFEGLQWRDAFLNSAMLLGGMGPVNPPLSDNGKIFAGVYALYAGLVFILVAGLTLSPVAHRILHKFHWG
jgi:hypothetical protein